MTAVKMRLKLTNKTPRVPHPSKRKFTESSRRVRLVHMHRVAQAKQKQDPTKPYFSPQNRCFMLGSVKLKGAHPFIKSKFFPRGWKPPQSRASKAWRQMTLFGEVLKAQTGWERGSKVDGQIRDWANGKKLPQKPHPITKIVLREIVSRGWTPGQGHVVVCSIRHRLGTAADARVLNRAGQGVLLELKVNTSDKPFADESGCPPLRIPGRLASPLSFAQLQLALTVNLFMYTYGCEPAEAYVVEATAEKAILHPLQQWARDAVNKVVAPPAQKQ